MLKGFDEQYINIVKNVIDYGYKCHNRTGVDTIKLPHQIMQFNLEKEFPILKSKRVAFKTAVKEILWIMQKQSNIVQDLRDQGVKIWNEWEMVDGTIGKAYGYQVKKFKQIDKLIDALKNNPQDRRMIINLWNNEDLNEMALQPCCFLTMWDVTDNHLNCMLMQRSGDLALGVPFNTVQYAVLVHLVAQATGLKPGLLTHVINNAHIYENHIEGIKEQINNFEKLENSNDSKMVDISNSKPHIKLNKNVKDFYDFTIDDIEIMDYKSFDKIYMGEVAI